MTVNIRGLDINYICEGQGDTVLLLHGWGSNITLFQSAIDLLKTKYRVIAMDMPGFGGSDEPKEPWCVDYYTDFVLDFMKEFPCVRVTGLDLLEKFIADHKTAQ